MDGYIRVSRVGGRDGPSFISPEQQREQIETWARLKDVEVVAWHTDLDVSGGTLRRPGLDEAMARVRSGQTGGIVVAYLDRLSRAGVPEALNLVYEIVDEQGGKFAAVDFGVDPTTPFGEFGLTILLGLARMQRRRIGDTWRDSRRRAVERGVHISAAPPTGYVKGEGGVLAVDPVAGPVVSEVFRRRAAGDPWSGLADLLNERGVRGPYDAAQWTGPVVQRMLSRRVYLGHAHSGDFVNLGAHEPLVDRVTWQRVRAATSAPVTRGDRALLAGLLRCAGCRYVLKPGRVGEREERIYRCRGSHSAGRCTEQAAISGNVIEPYVTGLFLDHARRVRASFRDRSDELEELERRWQADEGELAVFRDDERIAGALGVDRFVAGLEARTARAEASRSEYMAAAASMGGQAGAGVVSAAEMWDELEVQDRQALLHAALDCVFVRSTGRRRVPVEERTMVFWAGEAPAGLPRRGQRVPLEPFVWQP